MKGTSNCFILFQINLIDFDASLQLNSFFCVYIIISFFYISVWNNENVNLLDDDFNSIWVVVCGCGVLADICWAYLFLHKV